AAEDVLDKLCGLERLRRRADQVHQRGLLVRAWVNSECGLDVSLGLLGTVSGDDQPGVLEPLASLQRDAEVALCHALPPFPFGCPDGATVPYITPCANCQASVSGMPCSTSSKGKRSASCPPYARQYSRTPHELQKLETLGRNTPALMPLQAISYCASMSSGV